MSRPKVLISLLILLVIGLQIVPAFLPRGPRERLWPFLLWAMYKDSRPAGPIQGFKSRVVGLTQQGQREAVTPYLVGLSGPTLGRMYVQPWKRGDTTAAERLIHRLNRKRHDPFVELRLEGETYTVTDTGIVAQDNPVVTYRINASKPK